MSTEYYLSAMDHADLLYHIVASDLAIYLPADYFVVEVHPPVESFYEN